MNKRLDEALTKVKALSDDQQQEAAEILFEYIEAREAGTWLTPEQIAEVEAVLEENDYATEAEVEAFFAKFKK
ncbi:MAG TPA: hypothetical protein VJZ74_08560 [Pseudolabrys sp.]|nr:hypothetical protein [Pseudolabrys sp.]